MNNKEIHRLAVACYNQDGDPDIWLCRAAYTSKQAEEGQHYRSLAILKSACDNGYDAEDTAIIFADDDPPASLLLADSMINWDDVPVIDVENETINYYTKQ